MHISDGSSDVCSSDLSVRGIATYLLRLGNYTERTSPNAPNRQMSELGDPRWSANASSNYDFGAFDLSYSVRYIGKQTIGTWEAQNAYKDICPESGTISGGGTCTPGNLATFPAANADQYPRKIGRASCRERVCQYGEISGVAVSLKKQKKTLYTTRS